MNISIVGLGYVGSIDMACFASLKHQVIGYDVDIEKVDSVNKGKTLIKEKNINEIIHVARNSKIVSGVENIESAILNSDITLITVDTPFNNGELDMSNFYSAIKKIAEALKKKNSYHVLVLRSTIMPGTYEKTINLINEISGLKDGKDYDVVVNPEFIREGSAFLDFFNPPYILLGSNSKKAIDMMRELYAKVNGRVIVEDVKTVEMIKFVNNSYHALKVAFTNEVGNIAASLGVDSQKLMDLFCKDTKLNLSKAYFKPGFAYGGSCLTKDLNALKEMAHRNNIVTPIIDSIDSSNEAQKNRAVELILNKNRKKIAILGLSFKAGTDDIRNSPIIDVIDRLLKEGLQVDIYDENIKPGCLDKLYSKHLNNDLDSIIENNEAIVIVNADKKYDEVIANISDKYIIDLSGKYRSHKDNKFFETIN